MKRILVIGCCGSGKSTFSLKLGSILHLDIIHLDSHYWKPNWIEPSKEKWQECVTKLCQGDSWIMDGNYNGTLEYRINKADTVFFLNLPTLNCLLNVFKRIGTKVRPDIIPGCQERFEWDFIKYTFWFNSKMSPIIHKLLLKYKSTKDIHIFRSRRESTEYIHSLTNSKAIKSILHPSFSLRPAVKSDILFLIELRRQTMGAYLATSGNLPTDTDLENRVMVRFECAEIIICDNKPIGLLKVAKDGKEWALIQIQISPSLQRKGIGTVLIREIMEQARCAGANIKLNVLKTNPAAALYKRLGFLITNEGERAYEMLFSTLGKEIG